MILLLPIGGVLAYICSFFPGLVERSYATGINQMMIQALSIGTGLFPFSLAEIGVLCLVIVVGRNVIRKAVQLIKRKKLGKINFIDNLVNILAFIGIAYIIFILLWGLNYYRLTFAEIAHFEVRPNSTATLVAVCDSLIDQTNQLRTKVAESPDGVMKISREKEDILGNAITGYQRAAAIYPELGGRYGKAKGVLLSEPMSYLGFSGVYCPFTGEPNVNMAIPDVMIPFTVCHEMAHQRGFAREDEANYIAYITCRLNPDPDFQYSGYLLAAFNSMKMLKKYDMERYLQLQKQYSKGVSDDLKNNADYWDKHNSILERLTTNMNDLYLKSNQQHAGVASYNRMVDLLISEYRVTKGE